MGALLMPPRRRGRARSRPPGPGETWLPPARWPSDRQRSSAATTYWSRSRHSHRRCSAATFGATRTSAWIAAQRGVAIADSAPRREIIDPPTVDLDAPGPSASPQAQGHTPCRRGGLKQHLGIIGIRVIVWGVLTEALAGQPALAALSDLDHEVLDLVGARWNDIDEPEAPPLVLVPGAVRNEAVEVRVQAQGTAEPLDLGDGTQRKSRARSGGRPVVQRLGIDTTRR